MPRRRDTVGSKLTGDLVGQNRRDQLHRARTVRRTTDTSPQRSLAEGHRPRIAPALQALARPIDSIELHPQNPRIGDVEVIADSLRRFGQLRPIVVQASTGFCVAGNHLLRAARSLGWTEIAVNVVSMDDATAVGYMLADNRTADLGGYDDALLAAILSDARDTGNLVGTGYDDDDVAALIAAAALGDERHVDDCPALPAPADLYVRSGDLWELGRHRLVVGDATDPAAVTRVTGGSAVDLVWTDPPYGVAYRGRGRRALTIANDDLGEAGTRQLVGQALRAAPLKAGGSFYVSAPGGPLHLAFLLALRDADLAVHQTLIWVKDRFVLGHGDYHARHEPVLYGWRPGAAHHFVADRTQDTVWEIDRPSRNTEHPTMKPVALIERALRNSSLPGETVYDPFAGSGTTLIAAEISARAARVIELDPRYAQVIIERWAALTGGRPARRTDGDQRG